MRRVDEKSIEPTHVIAVSKILGHFSTQMTLHVYSHLYADDAALYLDSLGDSVFNMGTDIERTNVFTVTPKVSI